MNIFTLSNYKDFFKAYIEENNFKGIMTRIAEDCGCDRTYLSQVLNGKAELTTDHIIQFSEIRQLSEAESEYLLTLLLKDRSANLQVKRRLVQKIEKIQKEQLELSKKVTDNEKISQITDQQKNKYYSLSSFSAIHILTSIEQFQSIENISQKMNIPPDTTQEILSELLNMGLIKKEKGRYIHNWKNIYLTNDDPWLTQHHLNWRLKAVERTHVKQDVHYTDVFSVSTEDVIKIRENILGFISRHRKMVSDSGAEKAYAICCDFFEI